MHLPIWMITLLARVKCYIHNHFQFPLPVFNLFFLALHELEGYLKVSSERHLLEGRLTVSSDGVFLALHEPSWMILEGIFWTASSWRTLEGVFWTVSNWNQADSSGGSEHGLILNFSIDFSTNFTTVPINCSLDTTIIIHWAYGSDGAHYDTFYIKLCHIKELSVSFCLVAEPFLPYS